MSLIPCPECSSLEFEECSDIVLEDVGLEANTEYWWFLYDQFDHRERGQSTTDGDGTLTISASVLPEGWLMQAMGAFTIQISTTNKLKNIVALTINDGYAEEQYTCLSVSFYPASSGGEEPGELESAFTLTTTEVDLEPLLNVINGEALDVTSKNVDLEYTDEPMNTRLIQMGAKGELAIGLSESHEHRGVVGDNTREGPGRGINGTRWTYTEDCDAGPHPQYDESAILNGYCCADVKSAFGSTLDRAVAQNYRVILTMNSRLDAATCAAEIIIMLNEYIARVADPNPIVSGGYEFGNQGYDNATTFPGGGPDYVAKIQTVMALVWAAHPGAIFVINSIEVFKEGNHVEPWNAAMLTFDYGGRQKAAMMYNQTENLKKNLDGSDAYLPDEVFDRAQWKSSMLEGVTQTFPSHIALFKEKFPGYKLLIPAMGQSGGGDRLNDFGTINAMLGHALIQRQLLIEHLNDPDLILAVAWYKPGSMALTKTIPRFDWYNHVQYARLFQFANAKLCTFTTDVPDVYGIGVKGGENYVIRLINIGDVDVEIPNINIDGVIRSGFSGDQYSGISVDSQTVLTSDFGGVLKARSDLIITTIV